MNDIYIKRRKRLLDKIDEGIIFIPSASLKNRSNDTDFPFRQNTDFYYFTGFSEYNSILVLSKKKDQIKSIIYVEKKDPTLELWTGTRTGAEKAKEILSTDDSFNIEEFDRQLAGLLEGHSNVYIDHYLHQTWRKQIFNVSSNLWNQRKKPNHVPAHFHHLNVLTDEMKLYKDEFEIAQIKKASTLSLKAHLAVMAYAKVGANERDLEALLFYFFKQNLGGGPAYDPIVASGENANILHYVKNNETLKDGDLVLVDAGAEYGLYASDITRTFPVNGKYSDAQKKVYEIVLAAQNQAIQNAIPGSTLKDVHTTASLTLIEGLIELSILKGNKEDLFKSEKHRQYYPHGTGHWLGLDVHDQCPYLDKNLDEIKLSDGMVFTVEPGIYLPSNDENIPKEFRGVGIRIEDDLLITKDGNENLSQQIPKTIDAVEEACGKDFKNYI